MSATHATQDFDVADGGGDRNALAIRTAVTLRFVDQWGERDTGITTRKAETTALCPSTSASSRGMLVPPF